MKIESTNVQLPLQLPLLIADVSGSTSWDEWLSETEIKLKEIGYRKYVQNYKNEDFCYWKTFKNGEDKIYQIGILFYDFRKYADRDPYANRIGIMYECMLLGDDRIDMCVSKNIDLLEFESMAKTFHVAMSQYYCQPLVSGSLPSDEEIREAADEWVFDKNGMKWSNNDDTAGDNFGSFMAGAKWALSRIGNDS